MSMVTLTLRVQPGGANACHDCSNVGLSDRDLAVDVERHPVFVEVGDVAERKMNVPCVDL
jgi:hypothetical protein